MVLSVHRQTLMEIFFFGNSQYDLGGSIISLALNKAKLDWSQVFGEVLAWLCHHRPLRALYVFNQTPIASPISQPPQKKWERVDHLSIPPQSSEQQNVEDL